MTDNLVWKLRTERVPKVCVRERLGFQEQWGVPSGFLEQSSSAQHCLSNEEFSPAADTSDRGVAALPSLDGEVTTAFFLPGDMR